MASNADQQVHCQPCEDEEGTRLPAHGYCTDCMKHLCKNCFTGHKKQNLSKQHTLLDATRMPKSMQQPSTSKHTDQSDVLNTPCPKHKNEMIKFYCHDHEILLCSVCVTLEPSSCKVDSITNISGNIIDSKEYQDVLITANTTLDLYNTTVESIETMAYKSINSLKDALTDIKKYRQEINQRLDELERETEDAAKVIEQNNVKCLEEVDKDTPKSLEIVLDKIKQLNTSKLADKLFRELNLAKQLLKYLQKKTRQLATYDLKEYNFEANESILMQLKQEMSLGTITQKSLKQEEICVKTSKDKKPCWISGMTLLNPDILIIADHKNNAVKMVDMKKQIVSYQLQLDDKPWDVTAITNTELAVTLPEKQEIQFLSISSSTMIKKQTLPVDGRCYGISCHKGIKVVSFVNPAKLQIFDTKDIILKDIDLKPICIEPRYVACNENYFYVADTENNTVTKLNLTGQVLGCYSCGSDLRGISLSDDGTVMVCVWDRNVIEEIAEDCSRAEIVLENLNCPYALCWCGVTKQLYYTCLGEDYPKRNFIHMCKLNFRKQV